MGKTQLSMGSDQAKLVFSWSNTAIKNIIYWQSNFTKKGSRMYNVALPNQNILISSQPGNKAEGSSGTWYLGL